MVSHKHCGVNRICQLVGISKTTYYESRNPSEKFEQKYIGIKKYVEKVIESHYSYGIKRIKAELEVVHKVVVGRDTLGKLLKIWGLDLKRKVGGKKRSMIQKILAALAGRANLLTY